MFEGVSYSGNVLSLTTHPKSSNWKGGQYQPESMVMRIRSFMDSAAGGSFRFMQLCDKVCQVLTLVTNQTSFLKGAGNIFKGSWTATAIPAVYGTIIDTTKECSSLFAPLSPISGAFSRKCVSVIKQSAFCCATIGYALSPFLGLVEKTAGVGKSVFRVAEVSTFVADVCSLGQAVHDIQVIRCLANEIKRSGAGSSELLLSLEDTQTVNMLNALKSTCSVAGIILSTAFAACGLLSIPNYAILMATISLVGTVIGTGVSLYEAGMKYERFQPFSPKCVQLMS